MMNIQNKIKTVFSITVALCVMAAFTGTLRADLVIYEPFNYGPGGLIGTPVGAGTGLIETWEGGNNPIISVPGLSHSAVPASGSRVELPTNWGNANAKWNQTAMGPLMADGAELWFSVLYKFETRSTNIKGTGLVFSNGPADGSDEVDGDCIGLYTKNGDKVYACYNDSYTSAGNDNITEGSTYAGIATGQTHLIVGKISWGAGGSNDTLLIYLPDADLNLGDSVSSISANLNQSTFDQITFGHKMYNGRYAQVDEIRVAGRYEEVVGIEVDETAPFPVKAGASMITWSDRFVQLDPTAVNNDEPTILTYKWSASPSTGVDFSSSTVKNPKVTITNTSTSNPTTYTLTLAVNNQGSSRADVTSVMTIDVYDDACKAAKGAGLADIDEADFNANCITGLEDLAQMAIAWLVDYTIKGPVPR
jgi:hypothetical protein